jgi:uroporphyrinogen decarboxylase
MQPRERLLTTLRNGQADHVPACPDLYEMVPVRLTGRSTWEVLVYQDPPIWKARMDSHAYYGTDALIPLFVPMSPRQKIAVLFRSDDQLITREFTETDEGVEWSPYARIYTFAPPHARVEAASLELDTTSLREIVKPNYSKVGRDYFEDARNYAGERGVVAPVVRLPCIDHRPCSTYQYYDDPDAMLGEMRRLGEALLQQTREILSWRPDVLMIANSGLMIFNPEPVFRTLSLEWLKKVTGLAHAQGVLTHLHCCGPERKLVEIASRETHLSSIEPLEVPPMGDCILKELKRQFGGKLALKGNLHTTDVMLLGSVARVEEACRRAIDDAAEGGGFVLSTADQTPRDTPDKNIIAMQRVAETYGKY